MVDSSLAYMVCGAGTTFFLIHSERGAPIRRLLFRFQYFERMFACAFCTGYWVGILTALTLIILQSQAPTLKDAFSVILLGMGTGIVSIWFDRMIDLGDSAVHTTSLLMSTIPHEELDENDIEF